MKLKYVIFTSLFSISMIGGLVGGLLYYFNNKVFYNELEFSGFSENKTIYMHIDNNNVKYDIIEPILINNTNFMLTRFFLYENTKAVISQTLLDSNYSKISKWDFYS